jgi:ATP-dependent helicase/nuclease subunit B
MSLRFIYGRSGSGKSTFCLKDIQKKIEDGINRPLILLVPEQFSFQAERNVIKCLGESGAFKVQVLSFKRMADKVFNDVGGLTRKHMNNSGRSMLIYSIMEENSDKLKVYKKASKKQGFVSNVSDIITEFKRYNITLDIIKGSIDSIDEISLRDKLEDIYLIYSEFERRLHQGYIDSEDDLTMLAEKIDESHIFDDAEIWIDEFASFTPQEYKILEKLFQKTCRINVTLCSNTIENSFDKDSTDVFSPIKNTEEKLTRIISENNIKYEKPVALDGKNPYRFTGRDELRHLEKYLFSYSYEIYPGETEQISIFRALNRYSEVEETAKEIIRMCRDKDILFRDIAVVSGDLEGYESLVRAVFSEYGISYFIDKKSKIINSPLIVLVISAIEIISKNWSYEAVFRYLKTGLLGIEREEIDLLENYVLANGIRGKRWTEPERWEQPLNSEDKTDYLEKVNKIRDTIALPIINLSRMIKGKKAAKEMTEALYQFLCEINITEGIEKLIAKFEGYGQMDRAEEYNQIWDIIVEVLEQIVEVMGNEVISSDEFAKILTAGFEEYEIGIIPPSIDQVLVGSIQRVKSHEVSVVFIIGVNDGVFPAVSINDGVLSDDDRIALIGKGIAVSKDSKSLAFEEQFLTYSTLTTANRYLRLSFPASDFDGKPKRPSIIISRLKKIFPKIKEESNIIQDDSEEKKLNNITSRQPAFNDLITGIREGGNSEVWRCVINWYKKRGDWKDKLEDVTRGFAYNNKAEIFDSKKIRSLYGKKLNVSVSRLEKFVECPFSYFIQYGLKAKERKIYKLNTPDIGTLMHESLYCFSDRLKSEGIGWKDIDKEWSGERISEIVDEMAVRSPRSILNSSKRYSFIAENVKKVLKRSVWLIAEHIKRGEFLPSGYEVSFGFNGEFPPIEVELSSGEKVSLIGKVDRVDMLKNEELGETYIRIIDYKSGNKEFKVTDVYYKLQMQLLIYLDAILTEISREVKEKILPAGILYFKLDDPMIKSSGEMGDDDIQKRIMKALKMNGLILNNIDIIQGMDSQINGASEIIPVSINKDNSISARSSCASPEQFDLLRRYVKDSIKKICEEILEGNIQISPYKKKGATPCKYCSFSSICQFDSSIKENNYRMLKERKEEEIWKLIEDEVGRS